MERTTYRLKNANGEYLTSQGWCTENQVEESQGSIDIWFFDSRDAAKKAMKYLGITKKTHSVKIVNEVVY